MIHRYVIKRMKNSDETQKKREGKQQEWQTWRYRVRKMLGMFRNQQKVLCSCLGTGRADVWTEDLIYHIKDLELKFIGKW